MVIDWIYDNISRSTISLPWRYLNSARARQQKISLISRGKEKVAPQIGVFFVKLGRVGKVVTLNVLLLGIILQFQNCAASNPHYEAGPSTDGQVRIIEDWQNQKISLVSNVLQIEANLQNLQVDGLCAQNMNDESPLAWQLVSEEGVFLHGVVVCERGGFRVELLDVDNLACDKVYSFEVQTLDGEKEVAVITRKCS